MKLSVLMMMGVILAGSVGADSGAPQAAEDVQPLLIGKRAPDTILHGADGEGVRLREVLAKQPTVLIFYRGGWCPYCTVQLSGVAQLAPELRGMGYQVVGISPDRPENLHAFDEEEAVTYTLLSDADMETSKAFGIAFRVDAETVETYRGYGIDLEAASGADHHLLPVPSVFVLSTDGVIQFHYVNPDYTVRLAPDVLRAAAQAALNHQPDDG